MTMKWIITTNKQNTKMVNTSGIANIFKDKRISIVTTLWSLVNNVKLPRGSFKEFDDKLEENRNTVYLIWKSNERGSIFRIGITLTLIVGNKK